MRMGLAIDAACDVRMHSCSRDHVAVMPITVKVDGETFMDDREPGELQRFIERRLGSRSHSAETEPSPVEDVQKLFLQEAGAGAGLRVLPDHHRDPQPDQRARQQGQLRNSEELPPGSRTSCSSRARS